MTEKLLLKGSLEVLDLVGFSFLFPIIFFPNNGEKYSQKNVAMCFCFKVVGSLSTKSETESMKQCFVFYCYRFVRNNAEGHK